MHTEYWWGNISETGHLEDRERRWDVNIKSDLRVLEKLDS
jgi:hypothetical protein